MRRCRGDYPLDAVPDYARQRGGRGVDHRGPCREVSRHGFAVGGGVADERQIHGLPVLAECVDEVGVQAESVALYRGADGRVGD